MNRGSTLFLRATVVLIGAIVLAVCLFVLPPAIANGDIGDYRPILLGLYVPAVPFFFALYKTLKLLHYIDTNTAFSDNSVLALRHIKYCATLISTIFTLGMPYIFITADKDDAPGVILIGLVIIFTSAVIAVFAAVLERLLHNAIAIKAENDLTV